MNFRSIFVNIAKTLFVPVVCICLALVYDFVEGGVDKDIVIAILSARGNIAKRQALRDTWVGFINSDPYLKDRVAVKFVIGNKGCHIHDGDKIDPYSCHGLHFDHKRNPRDEMLAFKETISKQTIHPVESDSVGFDFKVHQDIIIAVLGVLDSCIQSNQNTTLNVSLYDASHKKVLVSANFSVNDPGMSYGYWRFKAVKQMVYPKGFEGCLVTHIEVGNVWQGIGSMHVNPVAKDAGVITIKKGIRFIGENGTEASFKPLEGSDQLANCNMLYVLDDSEEVYSWFSGKLKRDAQQGIIEANRTESLKLEQSKYNDLVFVDVVDVYSNIPSKLLKFYKWVSGSMHFKYIMKVDDDTFVVPLGLHLFLLEYKGNTSRSWWGSFRMNWKVNQYGKWADLEYNSLTYPPFACGSGNILSSDLVHWIAKNAGYLHCYQGEDISVGIWLAAVRPRYMHDPKFICDDECHGLMLLSAQNTIENIRTMWTNYLQCGNPCSCIIDMDKLFKGFSPGWGRSSGGAEGVTVPP